MKKVLVLIISLFTFSSVWAAEETNFSLNSVTAGINDEITVNLSIKNNTGFGKLALRVYYDKDVLEYQSSKVNGMNEAILKGSEDDKKGSVVLYALLIDTDNLIKDNGEILSINFKVKDTDVSESDLKVEVTDFGIDENNNLDYKISNGKVIIKDNVREVEVDDEVSLRGEVSKGYNNLIWKSSNDKIATVDQDGNVHFKSDGKVTITAEDKDTSDSEGSESNKDNVIYEKEYQIKKVSKKNYMVYYGLGGVVVLALIGAFIVIRKKGKGKNEKSSS